jgi:hypothetical protein
MIGFGVPFTGVLQVVIRDETNGEATVTEILCAFSKGNTRAESDLAKTKGRDPSPEEKAEWTRIGMDASILISRADRMSTCFIFPKLKAYCEMPSEALPIQPQKTEPGHKRYLGEEAIDGYPCKKYELAVTNLSGKRTTATVWEATALRNFPIKAQIQRATFTFSRVDLVEPAPTSFSPPSEYRRFKDCDELLDSATQRDNREKRHN